MSNLFSKYIAKDKKEDIFHSSAYGKAQSSGVIGTASTQSFDERMKVEKNRQIVQAYNDSRVVNGAYANGPKAKKYTPPDENGANLAANGSGGSVIGGTSSADGPKNLVRDRLTGSAIKSSLNKMQTNSISTGAPVKKGFAPPVKPKFGM